MLSLSHAHWHTHMYSAHTCTEVYAICRPTLPAFTALAEVMFALSAQRDLGEWISGFTGRMNNLLCFITSPISATKDDEWVGVLIELNIDLSDSVGAH